MLRILLKAAKIYYFVYVLPRDYNGTEENSNKYAIKGPVAIPYILEGTQVLK